MKRWWFLLLAFSLGLNGGLLYVELFGKGLNPDHSESSGAIGSREFDGPGGHRRPPGAAPNPVILVEQHLRQIAEPLGLSALQRDEIASLLTGILPLILEQQQGLHEARRALADQYAAPDLTPDLFRRGVDRLNAVQARLDSLVAEAMLQESVILTSEQRRDYIKIMPIGQYLGPPARDLGPGDPNHRPPPPPPRGH